MTLFGQVTCQNGLVSKQRDTNYLGPISLLSFLKVTIRKVEIRFMHLENAGSSPVRDKALVIEYLDASVFSLDG